jgi:hypothetical protein
MATHLTTRASPSRLELERNANSQAHLATSTQAGRAITVIWQRPDPSILSEAIPLFFIAQNRDGFWVARDTDGRVGGIFLLKRSALKFADKNAQPVGCAKMFLSGRFELDIENKGNPLVARLSATKRALIRSALKATRFPESIYNACATRIPRSPTVHDARSHPPG